jgi:hypothetical protein
VSRTFDFDLIVIGDHARNAIASAVILPSAVACSAGRPCDLDHPTRNGPEAALVATAG